ncbi:unnamed protein product [Musa banksii]
MRAGGCDLEHDLLQCYFVEGASRRKEITKEQLERLRHGASSLNLPSHHRHQTQVPLLPCPYSVGSSRCITGRVTHLPPPKEILLYSTEKTWSAQNYRPSSSLFL